MPANNKLSPKKTCVPSGVLLERLRTLPRFVLDTRHNALSGWGGDTDLYDDPNGGWVRFSDVEALLSSNARNQGLAPQGEHHD